MLIFLHDALSWNLSVKSSTLKAFNAHQWDSSKKPSNSDCNVLSHWVTISEIVQKTIDPLLASFCSRNCRSLSLNLNTFHELY